jgi:hypothetical protein
MEYISEYFYYDDWKPMQLIICGVAFIALIVWRSKVHKKQSASKPKLIFVASLVLFVCQFTYFQYQYNTPHSLFHEWRGSSSVDLDQIVSAETYNIVDSKTREVTRRWLILTLKNGKELKWNLERIAVRSRSGEVIHYFPEETLNLEY